ncbi:UNVERIFIED_CONTAM: hypothetical protein FKN15_051115 [Acipenser sinensis]
MMSVPFHACTSCKANISLSDKDPLYMWSVWVQHATEAMGREDFCDLFTAFQPGVYRNSLSRAMGLDTHLPWQSRQQPSQEIPCAQALVMRPRSCPPSPQSREGAVAHTAIVTQHLTRLGLTINDAKSRLIPVQCTTYFRLDSSTMPA